MICFSNNSQLEGLILAVFLLFMFLLGNTMLFILFVKIKSSRRNSTIKSTHKMQYMLFKALIVQLWNGYIFLLFQGIMLGILFYLKVENGGKICTLILGVISIHAWSDYIIILCFITPYRRALLQLLRLPNASNSNQNSINVVSVLQK